MNEKFKLIENYPNYEISNFGVVKNIKTGRILKNQTYDRYTTVSLSKNSIIKTFKIHKLVALAFVKNIDCEPDVNHKDGNKSNNHDWNLEWITKKGNTIHAQINGLKIDNRPIKSTRIIDNITKVFTSIGECSRYFDTNRGSIHKVLSGKRNQHKGCFFEYL